MSVIGVIAFRNTSNSNTNDIKTTTSITCALSDNNITTSGRLSATTEEMDPESDGSKETTSTATRQLLTSTASFPSVDETSNAEREVSFETTCETKENVVLRESNGTSVLEGNICKSTEGQRNNESIIIPRNNSPSDNNNNSLDISSNSRLDFKTENNKNLLQSCQDDHFMEEEDRADNGQEEDNASSPSLKRKHDLKEGGGNQCMFDNLEHSKKPLMGRDERDSSLHGEPQLSSSTTRVFGATSSSTLSLESAVTTQESQGFSHAVVNQTSNQTVDCNLTQSTVPTIFTSAHENDCVREADALILQVRNEVLNSQSNPECKTSHATEVQVEDEQALNRRPQQKEQQPEILSSREKETEVATASDKTVTISTSLTSNLLSSNTTASSTEPLTTTSSLALSTLTIDINAATPSVILPTLIETADVQGEETAVIPTVVPTTDSGETQPTQQLSFPDVSQTSEEESIAVIGSERVVDGVLMNMSDPVPTTISDDPLRTPPRPEIEDRTSATDQNIAPAASIPASIPPPVVLAVAPVIGSQEERDNVKTCKDSENGDETESVRSSATFSTLISPLRSHWKKFPGRHSKYRVDSSEAGSFPLRSSVLEQQVKSEAPETTQELHRLDLKIERMRKSDSSALPGHASDHRVANYHSVSSEYLKKPTPFHEPQTISTPLSSSRYSHSFASHQQSTLPTQQPPYNLPSPFGSRLAFNPHLASPSTTNTSGSLFSSSSPEQSVHHLSGEMMSQELSRSMSQEQTCSSPASSPSHSRHGVPSPSDMQEVLNLTRSSASSGQLQQQMYDSLSSPSTVMTHQIPTSHRLPTQTAYQRTSTYSPSMSRSMSQSHAVTQYTQPSATHAFGGHHNSGLYGFPSKHIPTSIPVSVVTSLSDQLARRVSPFLSNVSTNPSSPEEDERMVMHSHPRDLSRIKQQQSDINSNGNISFRNQTAGRKTLPSSVISTGTRTTSRHLSVDSPPLSMMSSQQHHRPSHHYSQHALQQQLHHSSHHQESLLDPIAGLSALSIPHSAQSASHESVHHSSSSSSHGHHQVHPHQQMPSSVLPAGSRPAPLPSGNPSKPFKCPLCHKNLASKNVYQLHLRSHSGEKPFKCNLCGNAFSQKTSLTRHMRSHTGERPFPCNVCGKRFADKERIKIHMRTHTGEKPFACGVCSKTFSQKSTVKRHMTVHTGEKPFKCSSCGKGFANRGNLIAHEKTHSASSALSVASATRHLVLQQQAQQQQQIQQQQLQHQMMLQQQMHLQQQHSMDQSESGPPSPSSSQHAIMSVTNSGQQQQQLQQHHT